ncbi:MAG: glycosyltransferase family 39 protein [Planctomycetes bacterium]|uniref:ArnT family glycosyltransferase n=1 Tax=Candidatus Wunengus sp. YC65 TaxID=3367701 RepID=UPI001D1F48BE|nr:glycosyltransferase family 39 protein [Planctomycetota bacterium]
MVIKDKKKIMLVIFIAALLLRIIFIIGIGVVVKNPLLKEDFEYGVIARSLIKTGRYSAPILEVSGRGEPKKETHNYRPTGNQLPFYPLVLAMVYSISSNQLSFWVVTFLQAIISALTCIVIYLIGLKLFNRKAAMIAGIISVIYPLFLIHTARIVPETFFTFWLSLTALHLLLLKDVPSLKHQLISGILLGITLLNSNVIVPVIPFIGIWLFWLAGTWKEKVKRVLLVMATAFLIVSPWVIRNYIVFKEFPLMKTTSGINLCLGNNPRATGTFFLPTGEPMEDLILTEAWYKGHALSETKQDKILYDEAMVYVKENPQHYARLILKRFYYFTWFPPDNLLSKEGRLYKKLFKIPYGFILMSSAIGITLFLKRNSRDTFLLCAIILSVVALYSIFIVGHVRYRMPIEPYMIIFSAYTINAIFEKTSAHYFKRGQE